jgi:hypothetical protein
MSSDLRENWETAAARRQEAIDLAVRRYFSGFRGLTIREAAQVSLRHLHLLPYCGVPEIRAEFREIMRTT